MRRSSRPLLADSEDGTRHLAHELQDAFAILCHYWPENIGGEPATASSYSPSGKVSGFAFICPSTNSAMTWERPVPPNSCAETTAYLLQANAGHWSDHDYDVYAGGRVIGRIMREKLSITKSRDRTVHGKKPRAQLVDTQRWRQNLEPRIRWGKSDRCRCGYLDDQSPAWTCEPENHTECVRTFVRQHRRQSGASSRANVCADRDGVKGT